MAQIVYQLSYEHNGHIGLKDQILHVLDQVRPSVVRVQAEIPEERPSSRILGTFRQGTGILIDDEHVLTVGYLILEAENAEITLDSGQQAQAKLLGIDLESGLGVLRIIEPIEGWPMKLGSSEEVNVGDITLTLGSLEENTRVISNGRVLSIQSFIGYWEYMLDEAIMVVPPNPAFGGSPLLNFEGQCIGVISLQISEPQGTNLAIPIDLFHSTKDELLKHGRIVSRPSRSWLGVYHILALEGMAVVGVVAGGPADKAGLQRGDIITHLNGMEISGDSEFLHQVWSIPVGEKLDVTIKRNNTTREISVRSEDRYKFYRTTSL